MEYSEASPPPASSRRFFSASRTRKETSGNAEATASSSKPGSDRGNARTGMLIAEIERLQHELVLAGVYIAEIERAQVQMSRTISQLSRDALTDTLTGLGNRRRFVE